MAECTSLPHADIEEALHELNGAGKLLFLTQSPPSDKSSLGGNLLVASIAGWQHLMEQLASLLRDYHRQQPLRQGIPREELKSRLHLTTKLFNEMLKQALREDRIAETQTFVHSPDHQVVLTSHQQRSVDALIATFKEQSLTPPSVIQAEEEVGQEVLAALVEQGRLVKLTDSVLFDSETYDSMTARIISHLKPGNSITVAQVRDMFGTSRKYALAVLEHMDEQRITRRVGDERILR